MARVAIACFSRGGAVLAKRLEEGLRDACAWAPGRFALEVGLEPFECLDTWASRRFAGEEAAEALVFVGATGIAVRTVAPYVADKETDPAVVSVDELGNFAVPLLSGHVGGANELARAVARICGGQAAVSTATDVRGLFSIDEWAARQGLAIAGRDEAKAVSRALLEGSPVGFFASPLVRLEGRLPAGFFACGEDAAGMEAVVHVGPELKPCTADVPVLRLVPAQLTVGVGCRRGTEPALLAWRVDEALAAAGMDPRAVRRLATVDLKAQEPAVVELARTRGWELAVYTAQELAAVPGTFSASEFVMQTVGVDNVCERAAVAAGGTLVAQKRAWQGTTCAVAAKVAVVSLDYDRGGSGWLR